MGAINYKNNEYISLGLVPSDDNDVLLNELNDVIDSYDFYYLNVTIERGCYEGLYIQLEEDYPFYKIEECYEKNEALKEITMLKKMYMELLDRGCCCYHADWCTTYHDYETSKNLIKKGIKKLKEDIKKIKLR